MIEMKVEAMIEGDSIDIDPTEVKKVWDETHKGKCLMMCVRKERFYPFIVVGPHQGPLFVCDIIVLLIVFFVLLGFLERGLLQEEQRTLLVFTNIFSLITYTYVFLINPGVANIGKFLQNDQSQSKSLGGWYCQICKLNQLNSTQHCYDCDVCIENRMFHFPWIGKCVGKNNRISFYLFIIAMVSAIITNCFAIKSLID